ncbi:uncharacterized protein LOC131682046 [Topomyia yanbarensis]|uniref:uncharacterized protein LOC131682046 n=1 Tax=Topomyia yanbarensis TaxID=2498891 RepID=UPI00273AE30E|nr:uncharacterized protein LOC131682046 [Topomyia yanbarensis]
MTNRNDDIINTISSNDQPEYFVNRSVPVLFTSRRGLQLRKFHSILHTGQACYTVQFCDLERWSNHFKLSSVGLTPDSTKSESITDTKAKCLKFVRESPQNQSNRDYG